MPTSISPQTGKFLQSPLRTFLDNPVSKFPGKFLLRPTPVKYNSLLLTDLEELTISGFLSITTAVVMDATLVSRLVKSLSTPSTTTTT